MEKITKPDVKTRKSGVRYVDAADILRSESGREEIRKAAQHSDRIRRNGDRSRTANRSAA
jgi:hypothetical protein